MPIKTKSDPFADGGPSVSMNFKLLFQTLCATSKHRDDRGVLYSGLLKTDNKERYKRFKEFPFENFGPHELKALVQQQMNKGDEIIEIEITNKTP